MDRRLAMAILAFGGLAASRAWGRGDDAVIGRLLRNQIEEIWGKGRVALVDATYHPDVVDHMPIPGQPKGLPAMKQVVREFRQGLPDTRMTLHRTLTKGDFGVDFWTMTATNTGRLFGNPPTGKRVEISGIDMVRVADGRIAELWHVEEMFQLRTQLGLFDATFGKPEDAAPRVAFAPPVDRDPGATAQVPAANLLNATETRNLAIARRHIEEIWAKGNSAVAYELYADDVVDHNPAPGQRPGIAGIVDVLGWLRQAAPDLRMTIERYLVDGDYAADRWVMHGTHSGTPLMGVAARGRPFAIAGMDVIRIRPDGRISDVWHVEEFDRLRTQIMG